MLKKLICLLERPQKAAVGRFALLCLLSPATDMVGVSIMIPVLQQAFRQGASARLIRQILFLALILVLVGLFELVKDRFSTALVMDISHDWSVKLYELYGMEELEDHSQRTHTQAAECARTDPSICAAMIPAYMSLAVDGLTAAVYAMAIIYVAGAVGVISCLLVAGLMTGLYIFSRFYAARYGEKRRQMEIQARGMISTMYGSYKELKMDPNRKNLLERYRRASAACAQVQKDHAFTKGLQGIILRDAMQSSVFVFLAAVLLAGVDLTHVLPEVVVFVTLLTRMLPISKRIVETLTNIQYGFRYYDALQKELDRYDDLKLVESERRLLREKRVTLGKGIRVENLSFCYSNGKQIFENAFIDIPAGCSTAVIGPSGEGKTTLLDLILGLLHPQEGHIWYDDFDVVEGKDHQGPCRGDIGPVVSYIPQIICLDDGTVRHNVAFTADEIDWSEERIIQCLECAQIWKDVREMPQGLDTVIGRNGTSISGGQRQRIALARALYKNSEILIMDEATAALDMETERAVIDSIHHSQGSKTLLMVTHHLSLANECERIYKLENRKLVRVK